MNLLRKVASTLLTLSALLLTSEAAATPQTYQIDPDHSRVEFTIRHMFSKVTGSFDEFSGTIKYDADAPATSSVSAVIQASSIDTNKPERDKHLKSPDFFDVATYPTLTFTSTKVTPTMMAFPVVVAALNVAVKDVCAAPLTSLFDACWT